MMMACKKKKTPKQRKIRKEEKQRIKEVVVIGPPSDEQVCRWSWKNERDGRVMTVTLDLSNKQVTWEGKSVMTFEGSIGDEYRQFGYFDDDDNDDNIADDDDDDDDDDEDDDDDDDGGFTQVFEFSQFDAACQREFKGKIIEIPKVVSRLRGGLKRPYDLFVEGKLIAENVVRE